MDDTINNEDGVDSIDRVTNVQDDNVSKDNGNLAISEPTHHNCTQKPGKKIPQTSNESQPNALDHICQTTVTITGTTLVTTSVVLIPIPIIPQCVLVYGGLLVLVT